MSLQNNIGDESLPPLFCRPRRSPKLYPDSRYASLLDGLGAGSRRQSCVPYLTADDSSSQCGGSSPNPRPLHARKLERSPLSLTESVSKTTLDNVLVQEEEEEHRCLNIKSVDNLFLSTEKMRVHYPPSHRHQAAIHPRLQICGSRSLDPFPTDMYNKRFESPNFWKENKCTRINSKADISEKASK